MFLTMNAISADLMRFSAAKASAPQRHLGIRYNEDGRFLPEPGNTVVCHLVEGSTTQQALDDVRTRLMALPEAEKFAFTPASSLHMTLFQGIIEHRRLPGYWPEDLPFETPIDDMKALLQARLAYFSAPAPFRVKIIGLRPLGLTVEGVTAEDRRIMAEWRDAFADVLGYRHPDHDSYEFHITLSYFISGLSDAALPIWQAALSEGLAEIARKAPVLELQPPAFCAFADMNHFEELLVFDQNPED
jgi:hypothetical protein